MRMCAPLFTVTVICLTATTQADILITEIMYDPALSNEYEYVELYNNGATTVDLTGYTLTDDPNQSTPNAATLTGGTIDPGGIAVLARIDSIRPLADYQSAWGAGVNFIEASPWPGFTNGGDTVQLLDPGNAVVATVNYRTSNGYPAPNDSSSIYMLDVEAADPYAGSNWALSSVGIDGARFGDPPRTGDVGSPGVITAEDTVPVLLITEIMYDPALSNEYEYVELFNSGDTTIDLTGYVLTDDPGQATPNPVTLSGGSVAPGDTAVLIRSDATRPLSDYQSAWGSGINFIEVDPWPVFANGGDTVQLLDPAANVIASVDYRTANGFPASNDSASIYMLDVDALDRYSASNWALSQVGIDGGRYGDPPRADDVGSPGVITTADNPPALLITEIMYDPALSNEYEYVELLNISDATVDLTGYTLRDDPGQTTPNPVTLTGGSIEAGGIAVLARVDATRPLSDYQSAWGSEVNFIAVEPWPGFTNAGDTVQLLDPGGNVVASVNYRTSNGYPAPNDSASIYMVNISSSDPYNDSNWALSQVGVDGARLGNAPRSGDVGSPGVITSDDNPIVLFITEVMYDPALNNEHEYVEIYNSGSQTIDLTGYTLSDDPGQEVPNMVTLTSGSIDPGGTAVLVRIDHARFLENYQLAWGFDINFIPVEPWPVYTNGGDTVQLLDPGGLVVASVNYRVSNGFPFPNDSASIYMLDVHAPDPYDSANWALSQDGVDGAHFGESPRDGDLGSPGFVAIPEPVILMTEIMYDPAGSNEYEYVELYNGGSSTVNLTGYVLTDDPNQTTPNPVTLTGGSILPGETAVLVRTDATRPLTDYQSAWGSDINFVEVEPWPVFSNAGDTVQLLDPVGTVVASVDYRTSNGFPAPNDSSSIYMLDVEAADPYDASNWALSQAGIDGARFGNAPRTGDVGSPGFAVIDPSDCGPVWADFDRDLDVDQKDFAILQLCLGTTVASGCECADRDSGTGDGDVDNDDVSAFSLCATGPAILWSQELTPDCVPTRP